MNRMDGSKRLGALMGIHVARAALSSEAHQGVWGAAEGPVVDWDVRGMLQVVDLEVPDDYPEGTAATRCSGCGQVRFVPPEATKAVWLRHYADCSPGSPGMLEGWP